MPDPKAGRGLIVLGMHRSGTSALTRALNLLGANLGDPADLYTAYDNPAGHWESESLIEANDRILSSFGGSWAAPSLLRPGWQTSLSADALLPAVSQVFTDVYADSATPWLWKDPRNCLTLPFWRRVLGDIRIVLVLRNPISVARSLNSRDGFRFGYGLALWDSYTRSAVAAAAGLPTVVVQFEDVLSRPRLAVEELASNLRQVGVDLDGDLDQASESLAPSDRQEPPLRTSARYLDLLEALSKLPRVSSSFDPPPLPQSRWRQVRDFGPFSYPWGSGGGRRYPRS